MSGCNVRNFEGVRYLNSEEIAELVNWDAEKFRQIRDDETKSTKERIFANEQLGKVLKEQLKTELAIAETALKVAEAMKLVYEKVGIDYDIHVSKINKQGIKILESK